MTFKSLLLTIGLCLVMTGANFPAHAQEPAVTDAAIAIPEIPKDELGRETPRGTFQGFMRALAEQDYKEAAEYMDLNKLSRAKRAKSETISQNFQTLLDRYGRVQPDSSLSNDPEGHKEDNLAPDMDNIANLKVKGENIPINVYRKKNAEGKLIWLVDPAFVAQIPKMVENMDKSYLGTVLGNSADNFKIRGAGFAHWLAMLTLYAVGYLVSGFMVRSVLRILRRFLQKKNKKTAPTENNIMDAFEVPLRLYFMMVIAMVSATFIGVSVIVRHMFIPVAIIIALVSMGLFLWGMADLIVSNFERRFSKKGRYNMTAALAFIRRGVKLLCAVIVIILILDSFGVDVTAGLAALGIGGIALALGAQKTLENLIGSVSIIMDQPFYVGDFCKIGDVSGTIEDIGMRSTRIRTNDRTLVTIPNGGLSTMSVENYARRPRFLMNRKMVLRYDSQPGQIRDFVGRAKTIITTHDKVLQEGTPVRFLGFVDNGYQVEIFCHIQTGDYNEFINVQADITYALIDAAWACGIYFAIPSQTFLPAVDQTGGHSHKPAATAS